MRPRPPRPTLFPYTTLFRSIPVAGDAAVDHLEPHQLPLRPLGALALQDVAPHEIALFQLHDRSEVGLQRGDRKSTRLNSSHSQISYAVFCLKKKKSTEGCPR